MVTETPTHGSEGTHIGLIKSLEVPGRTHGGDREGFLGKVERDEPEQAEGKANQEEYGHI